MGGKEEVEKSLGCLDSACSFIRSELARRLTVKYVPDLKFLYDDSGVKGARIEEILRDLREGEHGRDIQGDS